MVARKSLNLLPGIFQTDVNRKFLSATVDQLISEPNLTNINGFIGRKFAPTFKPNDSYINEQSNQRQNYQLEPSVVVKNEDDQISLFADYIGLINKIKYYGGITENHDRLFENQFYSYDPSINFDMFVNFSQYYWLPNGPDPVDVNSGGVPLSDNWVVTRNTAASRYDYTSEGEISRTLTLARGGTYTFKVDQPGVQFWIQSERGLDGKLNAIPTISSRDVLGVSNNGIDVGTVTFEVPRKEEHQRFVDMPTVFQVDYAAPLAYADLHNSLRSVFLANFPQYAGIVGQLDGKHLIFVDEFRHTSRGEEAWTAKGVFDLQGFQMATYDEGAVVPVQQRYGIWRVVFVNSGIENDPLIRLVHVQDVAYNEKVYVKFGLVNANLEFYKENTGFFIRVPLLTALQNELYIQDSERADIFTRIKIVDPVDSQIDIENDILGKLVYTSPNGVSLTNGLKIQFAQDVVPESYRGKEYYVENVGSGITLIDTSLLVRPENYNTELAIQYPDQVFPEYITIRRDSLDLNGWSRNNRWFHIDVITKTAEYNSAEPIYDQTLRAQRPIIEFEGNLQLANQGRVGLIPIDALDATSIDPFNDFEGKILDTAFGVPLFDGLRVLFAAARDPEVRGKIYMVNLVQYSADPVTGQPTGPYYVKLTLASTKPLERYDTTTVKSGQFKGSGWWYDGTRWRVSQDKSKLQQEPLFDVVDATGKSLTEYTNSTFTGTRLFGYLRNTAGRNDTVLGFPLKYRNFGTQGDIEFKNYFDSDTFSYDLDGRTISNLPVSEYGFLQKIINRDRTERRNCWRRVSENSKQYQIFSFNYSDPAAFIVNAVEQSFRLDITPTESLNIPYVKVFRNSQYLTENNFSLNGKIVVITTPLGINDKIDILVYSNEISQVAHYEVPANLNLNAQNIDIDQFTLGQLRNHLVALSQNSLDLDRPVLGPNNLRDLDIKSQGGTILQHSAPVPYSALFLIDDTANFVNSLRYAQTEYTRFKNKFLELSTTLPGVNPNNPRATVDLIIANINAIKNINFPWFFSDMVPYGNLNDKIEYVIFDPLVRSYEITQIFDDTKLSNRAILVYRNGILLLKDIDYTFDHDRPAITFTDAVPLQIDDVIEFIEYTNTDGSYIPETPTKLGLWPKYQPAIFLDDTYRTATLAIRGHDGSVTPAFNDYRDALLLELEKRIYNNIKLPSTLSFEDIWVVLPGKFRTNNYKRNEINQLLSKNFLSWVGSNKVDFTSNTFFLSNDEFTWNYSRSIDRIDGESMPGSWRACYLYLYDTVRPHTDPWEMLGFTIKPDWWEEYYGPAPYTGGNQLLWDDLEQGLVRFGPRAGIVQEFARPGLSKVIPVDQNGYLLPPSAIIAKTVQSKSAAASWSVGDLGPVEWAWRSSSDFPFAVQQALAMAKPAKFFGTKADVSRYQFNQDINQFLVVGNNHHFRSADLAVHASGAIGSITRTAGYINYISDYLKNLGIDAKTKIDSLVQQYEVKLAYKVAGFTDKKYLRVLAEQSSPTSTNDSVLIPDENYDIHLYKSTPIERAIYSGVIIEKTSTGYSVSGYNTANPFFTIIPSVTDNNAFPIQVLDAQGIVFRNYQNIKLTVPYGYEFKNQQQVVDFLISYERYLVGQGFVFDQMDDVLGEIRNWKLSAKEFLFWAQQGWKTGSILFLSPAANQLRLFITNGVVDKIDDTQYGTRLLDQNFNLIRNSDYDVLRDSGEFRLALADSSRTIGLLEINLVQYEHVMVFDNTTVFNDIIYKPELGNRQFRLKLIGQKTGEWDGSLYAPGFIFNSEAVQQWIQGKDYYRGELVEYKNQYYTALEDIPGSNEFPFNKYKQVTRGEIKTGLLPNFSTIGAAGEFAYDSHAYFKDEQQLRFSHSLIGFKPRQYLDDLGLNDTTQIELYKGYIKQKGSSNAIGQLIKAQFNNLNSDIKFYEEWAVRVGEYGALGINPYVEIILDESQYAVNPSTAKFVDSVDGNLGDGLRVFNSRQLYRSFGIYDATIALNRDDESYYDQDIPTAGYVHLDDVDATVFDLTDFAELNSKLDSVGVGYTIWVAKDFTQDWNVYRVSETNNFIVSIENALDGFVTLTSDDPHELLVGDIFVVRYFNVNVDGFYRVSAVLDTYRVLIEFTGDSTYYETLISEEGQGVLFKLDSMRFVYMEDARVYGLNNPLNYWKEGDKIWIDIDAATSTDTGQSVNAPNNTWKVYEKTMPWQRVQRLEKRQGDNNPNEGYGSAVKIADNGLFAVAGSPLANVYYLGNTIQSGHIVTLNRVPNTINTAQEFVQGDTVIPNAGRTAAVQTKELGYSVDIAGEILLGGAPGSIISGNANVGMVHIYNRPEGTLSFDTYQVLLGELGESGRFGASVTCDEFGNWIYVGAPNANKVYVYGLNSDITEREQLVPVSSQKTVTLSGTVTVNVGDTLVQRIYKKAANVIVQGIAISGANVMSVSGITGLYAGMVVNTAFPVGTFITSVDIVNQTVTMSAANTSSVGATLSFADFSQAAFIEATVLANAAASTTVIIQDRTGMFIGGGDADNIVVNNLGKIDRTDPLLAVADTGRTVVSITDISTTNSVALNFVPDLLFTSPGNVSQSLFITDYTRVFVPEIDYTVTGNTVTFLTGNLATGDYLIKQRPYYQLVDVLQGPIGSEFGYSLDASLDGAQLGIGSPNDAVNVGIRTDGVKLSIPANSATANIVSHTLYEGSGSVYVYDRVIEAFEATGQLTYATTYPIGLVRRVTVDAIEVDNYTVTSTNTIEFFTPPELGRTVYIETNKFNLLERLIGIDSLEGGLDAIQSNTRFGTDLTICSNNCAIYVGAPNYDAGQRYNTGAVWKFHNKGRLYGTNRGFTINPTFAPNDSFRLDNREIKVSLRLSNLIIANVGDTITQTSSGANVTVIESTSTAGQYILRVSDYNNANVFILGTGNVSINGSPTLVYPVRTTLDDLVADINSTELLGITAVNENNYLRIQSDSTVAKNLLRVLSGQNVSGNTDGISNVLDAAGMAVFAFMQIIVSPYNNNNEHFGNRVVLARNAYMLVIGTDRGTTRHLTTFDTETTVFDDDSTEFFDEVLGSGAVYIYELYDDPRDQVENPGRYAFAQQLDSGDLQTGDKFGSDIDIAGGYIIAGAPTDDTVTYFVFNNANVALTAGDILTQPNNNLSRYQVISSVIYEYWEGATQYRKTKTLVTPTRNHVPQYGPGVVTYVNDQPITNAYIENIIDNTGSVYIFSNPTMKRGWNLIRYQEPRVDLESVSRVFLYDRQTNVISTNLEFIDPVKGKILGVAEQEITYKTAFDPAYYNRGNGVRGNVSDTLFWGNNQTGQIWWNLSRSRFIDYEQDSLTYRANNWGRLFPGSEVEICEWVESTVLPSQYSSQGFDGKPIYEDDSAYVELIYVDPQTNIITSKYYYWVTGKNSLAINNPNRKIPTNVIRDLIANPKAQNIPYAAILSNNAIGFYNINRYLSADSTVCHIDHEIERNSSIIHSEYECIQNGNPDSFIPDKLANKLIDSLAGQDKLGKSVPDPLLSPYDKYGIGYRPRQSMFVDRLTALRNLVSYVNKLLLKSPIVREYELPNFLAQEPLPATTEYDLLLPAIDELQYVEVEQIAIGYKVLVEVDTTNDNLWVIYELTAQRTWQIFKTQSFKTSLYWDYVDWYEEGFDSTEIIEYVVDTLVDALKLPAGIGDEVLVRVNTGVVTTGWNLLTVQTDGTYRVVGIENGTIQLKHSLYNFADNKLGFGNQTFDTSRYDQNPGIEVRNILLGLKEDIFIRQLEGEFNKLFFVMVNYLFTEQKYVDWIFKTSFISVTHKLRALQQYPNFVKDNQTYYLDYINEVKPYSTKVREYNISYDGNDVFGGDITDFDLPPYYDKETGIFRSPSGELVDKDRQLWATGYANDILINPDYPSWYANKDHEVTSIIVTNVGSGYISEPSVTIIGGGNTVTEQATAQAVIDFDTGEIIRIDLLTGGAGYSQTPTVIINGGSDEPASAYAVLSNKQVRTFDTALKFDRVTYSSNVKIWEPSTFYTQTQTSTINGREYWVGGDIVSHTVRDGQRFVRTAYKVKANGICSSSFTTDEFDIYPAANFVTAGDRILGYYEPIDDMPGRDIGQLLSGIVYPGVEVQGQPFDLRIGFSGTYTANIEFNTNITVGVGNVITQPEADILLNLDGPVGSALIGQVVDQSTGAQGVIYGNTIVHGINLGNVMGVLGDIVNSPVLYVIKTNTVEFNANANIRISGVDTGVKPISVLVGNVSYLEVPIPDASMTVTKVWSPNKVQGVINSTQEFITGSSSPTLGNIQVNGTWQNARPSNIVPITTDLESSFDTVTFDAFDVDEDGSPILSEDNYDTVIRSYYTDAALGVRPEDINVDGGSFVDTYSSHAPEELVPGIVFDTLDIKVFQNGPGTSIYGFKIFTRNFQYTADASTATHVSETSYLRLCDDAATTLAQPLLLTDTVIYVTDVSKLPEPSPENSQPGVIFIGPERITYFERDIATNTLGRIRRGTKGTAAKSLHALGDIVVDGSLQQRIPDTTYANVTVSSASNVNVAASTSFTSIINQTFANGLPTGTGLDASPTDAAIFIKACNARNILGIVLTQALETEDAVNTITTEDGDDLYEEDF